MRYLTLVALLGLVGCQPVLSYEETTTKANYCSARSLEPVYSRTFGYVYDVQCHSKSGNTRWAVPKEVK